MSAAAQYEDFADRLALDLDVAPSPETRALMETIRARVEPQVFVSAGNLLPKQRQAAAEPPPQRSHARRSLRLLALLGILLVGGIAFIASRVGPNHSLDGNLIAVAPFDLVGPQPDSVWGEGLMRLLGAKLDGAGALRTARATTVAHGWRGRVDQVGGVAFARRAGAGLVVVGTIAQDGRDSMIVSATLLDAARDRSLGEVSARDALLRVDRVADSLAVGLLQRLGPLRTIRAIRLPSIGSASFQALKAFLQGEQFYRRGEMDSAYGYYDRAVRLDAQFALAINRRGRALSWTRGWYNATALADLTRAAELNRGLGVRDSLLLKADSLGVELTLYEGVDAGWWRRSSNLFDLLRLATTQYPADAEFWYELGVARLFYDDRPYATYGDALQAFDQATRLQSGRFREGTEVRTSLRRPKPHRLGCGRHTPDAPPHPFHDQRAIVRDAGPRKGEPGHAHADSECAAPLARQDGNGCACDARLGLDRCALAHPTNLPLIMPSRDVGRAVGLPGTPAGGT